MGVVGKQPLVRGYRRGRDGAEHAQDRRRRSEPGGGVTMPYVTDHPIDIADWRACPIEGVEGASVEFQGLVRREEGGAPIACLEYETYAPMAERVIARLVEQARQRWPVREVCVTHRVGRIPVGRLALFVGVRAEHRREAFEACQFLIDEIKREAPIWKTAIAADGTRLHAPCIHGHSSD